MAKILVVEDDVPVAASIHDRLEAENHVIETVHDGNDGEDRLRFYDYDLIILDWNLPGKTGVELCRQFRVRGGKTPVLMLTGRDGMEEKVMGLDAGADDYLTKPFSMRELAARVRAILRRPASESVPSSHLSYGSLVLDSDSYTVTVSGAQVRLLPKEFEILRVLMRNPKEVFSPDALKESAWQGEEDVSIDTIRTTIKRLRQKIEVDGQKSLIRTVHGRGYTLAE